MVGGALVARRLAQRERWFFSGMAIALAAAVFVGFAPTFFLRPWFPEAAANSPRETLFYVHGAFFAAWFAFLIVQTSLVAGGRVAAHRRTGWLGVTLALAMLVLGTYGAIVAARRGFIGIPIPGKAFLAIPLIDLVLFAVFVSLAIARRRDPQAHKRLMLFATVNLMAAAIARWPLELGKIPPVFFGLVDLLFVAPLVIFDLVTLRRLHRVTLWAGILTIACQPLRLWLAGTEGWARFASWLTG